MANIAQDGLADLVTNLPDSNGELKQEQSSEEGFFDIDVLTRKLEAYKASLEDAKAQIRRKRSINPREVSEVAAAARLKLRLDGRPAASSESHDNSVLASPTTLAFPSSMSSNGSSASETSFFDPITPEDHEVFAVNVVAATSTSRDTWKSSHSVSTTCEKGKTQDVSTRSSGAPRSPAKPVQETMGSKPPTNKLVVSRTKISSPLASPAFSAADWLDVPRNIRSSNASEPGDVPRKSIDEMSMCPRDEDRIRREIETYTIKDWVETENVKELEVIASSKEPGQVQVFPLDEDDDDLKQTGVAGKPARQFERYKYGKTTFREKFGSLLHRRTKTDKIIELYFDMETNVKPKATWSPIKQNASPQPTDARFFGLS